MLPRAVIQFQYGEDGLDVTQSSFVGQFGFLARNVACSGQALDLAAAEAASSTAHLTTLEAEAARLNRCACAKPALPPARALRGGVRK